MQSELSQPTIWPPNSPSAAPEPGFISFVSCIPTWAGCRKRHLPFSASEWQDSIPFSLDPLLLTRLTLHFDLRYLLVTPMCRNIKTLFNFDPPVTEDEVRAASLQFVRKISGFTKPSKANEQAFDAAVDEVASIAGRL